MTVTDLISFALLACASWRLVDATRTLRRVEAMHADADRRLNAAAEYAEQVHRNAAHLARIMHPSTRPAIAVGGDGRPVDLRAGGALQRALVHHRADAGQVIGREAHEGSPSENE